MQTIFKKLCVVLFLFKLFLVNSDKFLFAQLFLSYLLISELHGMDRTVLMRALKLLEHKGKLVIFKGTSTDDEGVKFSL